MRLILPVFGFMVMLCAVILFYGNSPIPAQLSTVIKSDHVQNLEAFDTFSYHTHHLEALEFCKRKNINAQFCILADMKRHSGLPRLFVWNFEDAAIKESFLVSHGCGNKPWGMTLSKSKPIFSNVPESHCSSLGKYKIGERGASQWGIKVKYLMHGLDTSNNNALKRALVLHSWEAVSERSVYPNGTPEGWGCPALSAYGMKYLDSLFQTSAKPVLFWQFEE